MLGDNSEKSKNPLKKAMRRRNAKTVVFSAPTYIEASDVEFSSDEESDDDAFFIDNQEPLEAEPDEAQESRDDDMVVEPLRPKGQKEKETEEPEAAQDSQEVELHLAEDPQPNDEIMESEGTTTTLHSSVYAVYRFANFLQMVLSVGRETALYGIRIRSSRMTQPNRRRFP